MISDCSSEDNNEQQKNGNIDFDSPDDFLNKDPMLEKYMTDYSFEKQENDNEIIINEPPSPSII